MYMCSRYRGRVLCGNVHRETEGHLELATRGTTATQILSVFPDYFFEANGVAFCHIALPARMLRYDGVRETRKTNSDANPERRHGKAFVNSMAAISSSGCRISSWLWPSLNQKLNFSPGAAHLSSYPASVEKKVARAAWSFQLLLLHVFCFGRI